ncbi:MAG TPA: hypothetical protein VF184_00760 [Phycisphaeraceae bacterium]
MAGQPPLKAGGRWLLERLDPAWAEFGLLAVSHVWLMIFLAFTLEGAGRRNPQLLARGQGAALVLGALVAAGVAGYAAALAEMFGPSRRVGRPSPRRSRLARGPVAAAGALLGLLIAIAASLWLGQVSTLLVLLTAAGMLFYQLAGRFFPAVTVLGWGLAQVLLMLIPNPELSLTWPVLLAMTHAVGCALVGHVLGARRPKLTASDGWIICLGWMFLSLLLAGLMRRSEPAGWWAAAAQAHTLGLGPLVAVVGLGPAAVWALHRSHIAGEPRWARAARFARLGVLWLILYDASWLISASLWRQAAVLTGLLILAAAARPILTAARQALEAPPSYRVTLAPDVDEPR